MKKIRILLLCCVFFFGIILVYISINNTEEKSLAKTVKIQGKENAINYIREKYAIDAKVKSVKIINRSGALFGVVPTKNVEVKMRANNKNFYVYITGEGKSTDGKDNYQFDEIVSDLVNSINNLVPIELYKYEIDATKTENNHLVGLLDKDKYYNGNNLSDIIKNMSISLFMHYIGDVDFNSIDFSSISDITENIYILMLNNYSSKSNYENSIKLTSHLSLFSPKLYFEAGGNYIESSIAFYRKEKQYFKNEIGE